MWIRSFSPNVQEIERRKSIKRFGTLKTPRPVPQPPLPFRSTEVVEVEEKPVGTYKAPAILTPNKQIYTTVRIFNLPITLTKRDFEIFLVGNTKAAISTLTFVTDKEKKTFKGFAFCGFTNNGAANAFIKDIDGKVLDSHKIGAALVKK